MISGAKYTERETGEAVSVDTAWLWSGDPVAIVTYGSGRRYVCDYNQLNNHFELVTPQEISFASFGGVSDRPTLKQRELDGNGNP